MSQIQKIVEVEQPITTGLVAKRIGGLWYISRVSQKMQEIIDGFLRESRLHETPNNENGSTWWTDAQTAQGYTDYRCGGGREIQDVPLVEIENAMRFVISQQIGIDKENLKRLTAKELGYSRLGNKIDVAANIILQRLAEQNIVNIDGEKVNWIVQE